MIKSPLVEKINAYGEITLDEDEIIDAMLSGTDVTNVFIDDDAAYSKFERSASKVYTENLPLIKPYRKKDTEPERHLHRRSLNWKIPSEYVYMDIVEFLIKQCTTDEEIQRVEHEVVEFNKRDELDVLRVMKYIVDMFREHNVVWGVGRGSSVSCFCLYLIGINKINPLKYGIPCTDYFKEM